ncbi:hypothetical protein BO99DRAFT_451904 [Aspergillus violaceofuscus CBS 115571]|uniref:Zn(2)-C6 fungal-type domain-containing protein n=1 Tax=Aspergillus violaceofuscus (strain CBS 115571) TaxID=1450538 RepID=A0A2V5HPA5_ASPV1|nr:hypothetical protein BO99DRAFT_451904 [Aspergillus violaceofuscus CBS 115571]
MASTPTPQTPRLTQRAPLSCVPCSLKKVKCNKRMPCSTCIRKGEASQCRRENVYLTGGRQRHASFPNLHYEEVVAENFRLRAALSQSQGVFPHATPSAETPAGTSAAFVPDSTLLDYLSELFNAVCDSGHPNSVFSPQDIHLPSRELSDRMLAHAGAETTWHHFAIHYPTFMDEHDQFWRWCSNGGEHADYDPHWLAIYFSLLAEVLYLKLDDWWPQDTDAAGSEAMLHIQNWFDAAIFLLQKADFIRAPDIRCVQAIAILGDVFIVLGHRSCFFNLWPVAIRTAQMLGIDREENLAKHPPLEAELYRRLWWSLVIGDWYLAGVGGVIPARAEPDPRPMQYQLALIEGAKIYYEFQQMLRAGKWMENDAVALVARTDEKIAKLIAQLPAFLRADGDEVTEDDEFRYPWMEQQRSNICYTLLDGQIAFFSTLTSLGPAEANARSRARSVCVATSRTILQLALQGRDDRIKNW